jgi:hypothetical protein
MNLSLGVMVPIHVVCDVCMVSMRVSGTVMMGGAMPSGGLSAIATEILVQRSLALQMGIGTFVRRRSRCEARAMKSSRQGPL